ncbi:zeta toxin family protein [Plebeiibacterium marinum]|uniref:Phosphoribulokinase/uridine kinase domain-containing protein n=1 Tax=Plebeiibacterium marinum TaxID=2992111 RepID=A0AAE3MEZ5_9BACT|nr:zeta toxin family protein [Plebeiobacterium marinum]MCW3806294.1 hypothetical protein [Plebeiobacterium marinum]
MNPHENAASIIIPKLVDKVKGKGGRYIVTLAGESGCGKTETGKALVNEFARHNINALVLGQDNYFHLAPLANDARRKADPTWLGPRKEVNLKLLNQNLKEAIGGADHIDVQYIDYDTNVESTIKTDLRGIEVVIVEGTYTSLLKNIDTRIFIDADYNDTLKYRKIRNRGNEVNDPFVEGILETEHKIISGHIFLADFIISKDYEVEEVER